MSVYGITPYGTSVYGLDLYPAYSVEPFTAQSVTYGTVQVSWTKPTGTILRYRLLANRYGYPVNENDGTVLFDSATYPGSNYADTSIIPGTYHYYGFYVLADLADNIWIRSGVAGCLAIKDYGSSEEMWRRLPNHFRTIPETDGYLTGDAPGDSYLQQFVNVIGFGVDYLRTQYGMMLDHCNDPMAIPIDDLWNLAAEVGLKFSPEMPAYTIRKAVANQAHVCREGGTTPGIENEIILRTGWSADITTGANLMLEDDQSTFLHPVFYEYTRHRCYNIGECVWFGPPFSFRQWPGLGYWYKCISPTQGIDPPASGGSNANWQVIRDSDDTLLTLVQPSTGMPSTWEAVDLGNTNGVPTSGSVLQGLGVQNIANTGFAWNCLRLKNKASSSRNLMLRSVCRKTSQVNLTPWAVDPQSAVQDAVPVPYVRDSQQWDPTIRYGTGDLVLYQGQPFKALRASTGITPPTNDIANAEWTPLSESRRIRIATSGYVSDNMTGTAHAVKVVPCMEWYDCAGNFITRITARNTSSTGVPSKPDSLAFDSFTSQSRVYNVQAATSVSLGPWLATFWPNGTMSGRPAGTLSVPSPNFSLDGYHSLLPDLAGTGWSGRWVTQFVPQSAGNYTFSLKGLGGGVRMLVNGVPIISDWYGTPTSLTSSTVTLKGGTPVSVEVDYRAPDYTPGTWTANLIPQESLPLTLASSNQDIKVPPFYVVAGAEFIFSLTSSGGHAGGAITWYGSNGQPVGCFAFPYSSTAGVDESVSGFIPGNATSASIEVMCFSSFEGMESNFQMRTAVPQPSALTVTSPISLVPTGSVVNTGTLTGRLTDDETNTWLTPAGNFLIGYGNCWPLNPGQRSIGLVTGPANTNVGVTFRTSPQSGQTQGIVFRYTDDNNYWRCGRVSIRKKVAGVWTTVATHSTTFLNNDRMILTLSGSSIKVFRNAASTPVTSVTDTFNSSATKHGIIVENS